MNLIWALLQNHCGTTNDLGSLSHFFLILEKTCLGGEHPDYHTLLSTLMQILDGLLLNAWQTKCGSLEDYAHSKPSAHEILWSAHLILNKYATPECKQMFTNPPKDQKDVNSTSNLVLTPSPNPNLGLKPDTVYENTDLLTRDLLYVAELISAISTGDFG